jgi:UDP-N-acetyl-D-galactosamine dehydrogenase
VVGYDINQTRVAALQSGSDSTFEVDEVTLQNVLVSAQLMQVCTTTDVNAIAACTYYIVTVPTPVDKNNRPNLTPLYKSSETVGSV